MIYRYWTFQYLNNIEVVSKAIVIRHNTFDNISISTEKIKGIGYGSLVTSLIWPIIRNY